MKYQNDMKFRSLLSVFVLVLIIAWNETQAQKVIRIDNVYNLKSKRFYIGDVLVFQLKGEDHWYREEIIDIMPDQNAILFSNRVASQGDITAIRTYKVRNFGKVISRSLYTFGSGWLLWSALGTLAGGTFTLSAVIISGTALMTGLLFDLIFRHRTYKIGKRRVIRLLHLTPETVPTSLVP